MAGDKIIRPGPEMRSIQLQMNHDILHEVIIYLTKSKAKHAELVCEKLSTSYNLVAC